MDRPHGRARVDTRNPQAFGQCDLCGFWFNLDDMRDQMEWAGTRLYNTGSKRCDSCLDKPFEQFRTIILPPDPPPLQETRVPNLAYEEQTVRITQYAGLGEPPWGAGPATIRCLQNGITPRILQFLTSS